GSRQPEFCPERFFRIPIPRVRLPFDVPLPTSVRVQQLVSGQQMRVNGMASSLRSKLSRFEMTNGPDDPISRLIGMPPPIGDQFPQQRFMLFDVAAQVRH